MPTLNFFRTTGLRRVIDGTPIVALDVGSRGGIEPELAPIAWAVSAWGFEPDRAEWQRLQHRDKRVWRDVTYLPDAIAGTSGERELHIPRDPAGASLLRHDAAVGRAFAYPDLFEEARTLSVSAITLDDALAKYGIPEPAFIKLDVEGAELEILRGAPKALAHAVAVKAEVAFLPQRLGQPLAADVDSFMKERGFFLMDFRRPFRWRKYATTTAPHASSAGISYSAGQLSQGDYLFFRGRDALSTANAEGVEQCVRLAIIALCFGFFDHAWSIMEGGPVREYLSAKFEADLPRALERASRRYGRRVALRTVYERIRELVPLSRSVLRTFAG